MICTNAYPSFSDDSKIIPSMTSGDGLMGERKVP